MLFTPHTLVGGAIGLGAGNVASAFILGFISHFILDFIPHYDSTDGGKFTLRQNVIIAIDLLIGGVLLWHFWTENNFSPVFFLGAFGGILPDLLDIVPFWRKAFRGSKFGNRFHQLHDMIQSVRVGPVIGIATQLVLIFIAYFMLK